MESKKPHELEIHDIDKEMEIFDELLNLLIDSGLSLPTMLGMLELAKYELLKDDDEDFGV